jgi:hypothetical protein
MTGTDDELDALQHVEGVDTEKIIEQISGKKKVTADPLKTDTPPPVATIPPVEPPKTTPPTNVPDPEAIKTAMLHEMWGEQFKTVEDFKKANIPGQLQELETLRRKTQDLETKLKAKPKHNFASDDIAKFNEFVRDTGIKDVGIFNRINEADVANMDDLNALALQHVVDNPHLASRSPQEIRKYFERKYNVDATKVESGDLTQEELDFNLMDLSSEGAKAKAKLRDLKSKIHMPEIPAEEPDNTPKRWTPEIESNQKNQWSVVNEAILKEFSTIPIIVKSFKEPIVNFVLPEETKKTVMQNTLNYAINNQMEVNEANVKSIARDLYSNILFENREEIYHAIFERARTITQKDYLEKYHNPSPLPKDIMVPAGDQPLTEEQIQEQAYQLETKR